MADEVEQLHGQMQSTQADQQRSCSEVQDLRAARDSLNVELQQLRDQLRMGSGAQQQATTELQELRSDNHNLKQQLQVSSRCACHAVNRTSLRMVAKTSVHEG